MASASVRPGLSGSRDKVTIRRRKNGVAASVELSTRMSVICIVKGSSIHNPR